MRSVLLACFALFFAVVQAQSFQEDIDRLTINPCVLPHEALSDEAAKLLQTKLLQIITANGVADNECITRFILTARINVLTKDVVPGPPQRVSMKMEITLMLGDVEADKLYSSMTIPAIGIGISETKAYMAALKNIKPGHAEVTAFMEEGKRKIMEYYETHSEAILAEAQKLAGLQNYAEALDLLSSVPNVCGKCYQACSQLAPSIYYKWINADGAACLQQARTIWAKSPNREGAEKAMEYLSRINFAADCVPDAQQLTEQIKEKMLADDKREWEFKMQQYKDNIEREKRQWAQHVQEYQDRHERIMAQDAQRAANQRLIIKACRDIAVERARYQPRVINFNRINVW
ncbi:MAG: hypothetical protein ACI37U_02780 [Bacteroides sp.]